MSETTMSNRNWRYDRVDQAGTESDAGVPVEDRPPDRARSRLRRWQGLVQRWASAKARCLRKPSFLHGERILHEFVDVLAATDDRSALEQALADHARRLVGGEDVEVEWDRDPSSDALDDAGEGRFLLRQNHRVIGQLTVRSRRGGDCRLSHRTRRRLRTLCNLTALAWGRHARANRPSSAGATDRPMTKRTSSGGAEDDGFPRTACLVPDVQDATFLHAVLPFAIGQSRRHGEPLSILCIAVDRLGGIAELLGRDRADQVVRNTALHVAGQIRTSDFVSRLEDGRLIAVLPRAAIHDATRVAEKLRDAVEQHAPILSEVGGVTVCIGVAEFPACAGSVFALFDAADHALSLAKSRGPGQVAAAPVVMVPESVPQACCAG